MRVLVVTQALDTNHPVLGFFHQWVEELAMRASSLQVIALSVGAYTLPSNVTVQSLGKEKGQKPSFIYAFRFLSQAWKLRNEYDVVFVHMNQEYVLLAGVLWKLLGKRVYMWRNHYAGSLLTDVAAMWCEKVFYTSAHSYTARYKNSMQMPLGIHLASVPSVPRAPRSILFLSRISPAKRPHMLVKALAALTKEGVAFETSIVGPTAPIDESYAEKLEHLVEKEGMASSVSFKGSVPHKEVGKVYAEHAIYINLATSGMFDKTIGEAAQAGCLVLAVSDDWHMLMNDDRVHCAPTEESVHACLTQALALSEEDREALLARQTEALRTHSLPSLADKLVQAMH